MCGSGAGTRVFAPNNFGNRRSRTPNRFWEQRFRFFGNGMLDIKLRGTLRYPVAYLQIYFCSIKGSFLYKPSGYSFTYPLASKAQILALMRCICGSRGQHRPLHILPIVSDKDINQQ